MIAVCTLRHEPHYRRHAFESMLRVNGYRIDTSGKPKSKLDLFVTWNRQQGDEQRADDWEARGGSVIVCENAYLAPAKWSMYAISLHGHCGSGWFPVGDEDRFSDLGIPIAPWKEATGDILVCGQRGIGSRQMASPRNWEIGAARRIGGRIRRHPGRYPTKTTLEQDLRGASLCAVWSSAAGVQALASGIPVAYFAPHWICAGAATRGYEGVARPLRSDEARSKALHRMAHGQWTVPEIESGEPLRRILERIGEAAW